VTGFVEEYPRFECVAALMPEGREGAPVAARKIAGEQATHVGAAPPPHFGGCSRQLLQ
jgi:hypothetical protein